MELKPGYKQTEVGVIPEDWDVRTVGDIAIVGSGGTPNRKNPDFWDGDIPWITTAQIDGGEIKNAEQYITKSGLESSAAKWYLKGTILMAMYGQGKTRGKTAILGIDATINQACAAITVSDRINKKYLLHYLIGCYDKIRELSNSGGQENLNSNIVKSITVIVPTKTEQTAIANALSDADALIQSLTRLIAKKRQIKQGAMQTLLTGEKRLTGFQVKPGYKQTEVGVIPEDWNVAQLNEVADKITVGFVGTMAHLFRSEGIPLLRGQNVLPHKLDLLDTKYISSETHKSWKKSSLRPGDVVMVRVGYPGTACVIPDDLGEANAASLVVVTPKPSKLDSDFLCYIVNSEFGRRQIDSYLVGGAQQVINTTTAAIFKFPLPPTKTEQIAIATILSDMDTEIAALETKLAKYRHIKQGMMQNLLTGRIRLVKPESKTGAVA